VGFKHSPATRRVANRERDEVRSAGFAEERATRIYVDEPVDSVGHLVESADFWAETVQLTAVLALALVIEIRAMHQRVQTLDKLRTKGARVTIALMYAFAVFGLTSAFYAGLSGMTGAEVPGDQAEMILWALIFTFSLLVAAPTIPLIWALIDDLPFSPDGVARWKLSRLQA
jgi:hypothetical protein